MKAGTEVLVDRYPRCGLCEAQHIYREARYDARAKQGGWAFMCPAHYRSEGVGLGVGNGQRLVLKGKPVKQKLSFEDWMSRVDDFLVRLCGVTSSDLPDSSYRDAYDDGTPPGKIALEVFHSAEGGG